MPRTTVRPHAGTDFNFDIIGPTNEAANRRRTIRLYQLMDAFTFFIMFMSEAEGSPFMSALESENFSFLKKFG